MNTRYDKEKAGSRVRQLFEGQEETASQGTIMLDSFEKSACKVVGFEYPRAFRLMQVDGMEETELHFKFFGVLCDRNLPPLTHVPRRRDAGTIRNLRQHVRITGLGDEHFQRVADSVFSAQTLFCDSLGGPRQVTPPSSLPYEGFTTIDAHARYFTDRTANPFESHQPFLPGVDPNNILESLRGEKFIHTMDNQVEYAVRVENDGENPRYKAFSPADFGIGDVVEVTVSFMAVPIKGGVYKFMTVLKGLCLVDKSIREASQQLNPPIEVVSGRSNVLRKRRIFLDDEEVKEAQQRLQKLRMA
ncbi:hypothetical protein CC1G_04090 [Coprinopsis cinerea okayama7|uniref:Uncharacterized protein n=1 Tax=Coprinopsis cinerea (strain Okayama-7 / 130 / ATCC MYA-4618 / FGSC 9003) TaxID=240176 RepID=A8NVY0_COPC7|nr:hypothetical protein CC1G_04090 [Coprinopsis cinerea okayama7\|eukprot:XP_001836777.1 hypothetical protein CC1G_04090 [Coprinopsis cinerea okayama7\